MTPDQFAQLISALHAIGNTLGLIAILLGLQVLCSSRTISGTITTKKGV